MPGRVQSIGTGPGRRGLVGAAQLDALIPRMRVCVGIAQVAVQKKNRRTLVLFLSSIKIVLLPFLVLTSLQKKKKHNPFLSPQSSSSFSVRTMQNQT